MHVKTLKSNRKLEGEFFSHLDDVILIFGIQRFAKMFESSEMEEIGKPVASTRSEDLLHGEQLCSNIRTAHSQLLLNFDSRTDSFSGFLINTNPGPIPLVGVLAVLPIAHRNPSSNFGTILSANTCRDDPFLHPIHIQSFYLCTPLTYRSTEGFAFIGMLLTT